MDVPVLFPAISSAWVGWLKENRKTPKEKNLRAAGSARGLAIDASVHIEADFSKARRDKAVRPEATHFLIALPTSLPTSPFSQQQRVNPDTELLAGALTPSPRD